MREIIFRGKRVDNGKWVYGSFIPDLMEVYYGGKDLDGFIKPFGKTKEERVMVEVERNTVGQYTGLTDKNGTRIFEGDIVKITGFHTTAIAAVKYGSPSEKSTSWGWYFDDNDGHTYFLMSKAFCRDYNAIIIGNIHDNPELLKGE